MRFDILDLLYIKMLSVQFTISFLQIISRNISLELSSICCGCVDITPTRRAHFIFFQEKSISQVIIYNEHK